MQTCLVMSNQAPCKHNSSLRLLGRRFAAALLPRLFGTNPMSHHKGGFEPETNGFQFYAIANLDKTSLYIGVSEVSEPPKLNKVAQYNSSWLFYYELLRCCETAKLSTPW